MSADPDFRDFYQRESGAVFQAVYLLCRDRAVAEDSTQEAFARALERWKRLKDQQWVGGWVTSTAFNVARRSLRRRRTAEPVLEERDVDAALDVMHDDDRALSLLARTPIDVPGLAPRLDPVERRGRFLRRRRLAWRAALATVIAATVAIPLLWLDGVLAGPGARTAGGGSGRSVKLIEYREPSSSMAPTVRTGDVVWVDKDAYRFGRSPELGDIVLFTWSHQGQTFELLKRVIGLPGQTVVIRRGVVLLDGHRLVEPYLNPHRDPRDYGPFVVQAGHLFVLGDDRINSNDSRYAVGQVPLGNVIGKVMGFESDNGLGRPLGKPTLAG